MLPDIEGECIGAGGTRGNRQLSGGGPLLSGKHDGYLDLGRCALRNDLPSRFLADESAHDQQHHDDEERLERDGGSNSARRLPTDTAPTEHEMKRREG